MHQVVVLHSVSRNVRPERKVPHADEGHSGVRSPGPRVLLREASSGKRLGLLAWTVPEYSSLYDEMTPSPSN